MSPARSTLARRWPKRLPSKRVNRYYARDFASEFGRPMRPYLRVARLKDEREAWAIEHMNMPYEPSVAQPFDDLDYFDHFRLCDDEANFWAMDLFEERYPSWRQPLKVEICDVLQHVAVKRLRAA